MTPPPPPFRLPWHGEARRFDPALDDAALATARDALTQGRWAEARTLLLATGTDWDRRGHRLAVLAAGSGSEGWARDWQQTEPESPDAAALVAFAATAAAVRGKTGAETARQAVDAATRLAPEDPSPALASLLLARHSGFLPAARQAFDDVHARHPDHHHAHHLMAAVLADGSDERALTDFAKEAAARAPADSPLALLPVVAHAELFRARCAGARTDQRAAEEHWRCRQGQHLTARAFDWWLEWGNEESHPRRVIDLNFLTYAKFHEGRMAEAAALFQRVGALVTPAPWSYAGRDPGKTFRAARATALGLS